MLTILHTVALNVKLALPRVLSAKLDRVTFP
jgi:hypothetical protein